MRVYRKDTPGQDCLAQPFAFLSHRAYAASHFQPLLIALPCGLLQNAGRRVWRGPPQDPVIIVALPALYVSNANPWPCEPIMEPVP